MTTGWFSVPYNWETGKTCALLKCHVVVNTPEIAGQILQELIFAINVTHYTTLWGRYTIPVYHWKAGCV